MDSAGAMARAAVEALAGQAPAGQPGRTGTLRAYVTDASRLDELAPRFLGERLGSFDVVDLQPAR